ncbi:MAG: trypsin-like serine protease [Planctomycetes bacterium]|nr:trypsin-like serine protease [Planctomycetota bacterium]
MLLALAATALAWPARALMVGEPPDSPRARLDANRADSPWSGVASLFIGGSVSSAVLIAPRFALTAAHVLRDGADITLNLNIDGDLSHQIAVRRAQRHPAFRGFSVPPPVHDLALLELAEPAPVAARRYPLSLRPPAAGDQLDVAGYGGSGHGSRGVEVGANAALKRRGRITVQRLEEQTASRLPLLYFFDYTRSSATPPTGLGPGDSGSGVFRSERGEPVLVGINTITRRPATLQGPAFGYGTVGGGQVLAAQADWLRKEADGVLWLA